ncbi:hypothetical protein KBZ14_13325 [Synechococcus sp. HJ21-Hayes]|nr:hypothetical protein [Synechococcus sp. JJ3a-Johnson]MCP9853839.1 hypothetical protein [Synechococcus sp. HJ21-Hayes]
MKAAKGEPASHQQACGAELLEPNAMVLGSTNGEHLKNRTVLLKAFDQRGFVFFTTYNSRKEIERLNPEAAGVAAVERRIRSRAKRSTPAAAPILSRPFSL